MPADSSPPSAAFAVPLGHAPRGQHALHGRGDFLGRERFGHIVARPQTHRRRGVGNAGVAGNDQHRNFRLRLPQLLQKLNAIHVGHLDVQQDDLVFLLRGQREALPGIRVRLHIESLPGKNPPTGLADDFLVIDHQ